MFINNKYPPINICYLFRFSDIINYEIIGGNAMNFKIKCFLQTVFSNIPKGEIVNYWFQKYVTKSFPISDQAFQIKLNNNIKHFENFKKYVNKNPKDSSYYEFGAGWDLASPIFFSSCCFKELYVIDIRKLINSELIQHTVSKIFPAAKLTYATEKTLQDLRIHYNAPMDARNTSYQDQSMDLIISTATLEHIPRNDILAILKESHRLLKPNGIFSSVIDYKDHWSYFDKSITPYNYLKYSKVEWEKYNPSLHYQNRLRHRDYLSMFEQAGFEILEINPCIPENGLDMLGTINIHDDFKHFSIDELVIGSSEIVVRKHNVSNPN